MNIPIITYHAIGEGPRPLWISAEMFENHLRAFGREGYQTVTLEAAARMLKAPHADNAPKPLVITFDDGYRNFFTAAWPILERFGFSATLFVVTDLCDGIERERGEGTFTPVAPVLSWDEIRYLAGVGCEIGSHTRTHPHLPSIRDNALILDEVVGSKRIIEQEIGKPVRVLAYPYGSVESRSVAAVRASFRAAVTTELGVSGPSSDAYLLERVDAYYLSPMHVAKLSTSAGRLWLRTRRALRSIRRRVRPDFVAPDHQR